MAEKPNNNANSSGSGTAAASTTSNNSHLETSKAERHVWLMKCPPVVARAMQNNHHHPLPPLSSDASAGPVVAKVVVAVDPLLPNDDFSSTQAHLWALRLRKNTEIPFHFGMAVPYVNSLILFIDDQFTMELAGTVDRNMPKSYSMNMSTDFIPMSVFAESSQGKPSVEGKIYHKFDMKPHNENIEDYAKLCRERTNKYMTKTRQIQIIDDDSGMRMRPMPGMFEIKSSGSTDKKTPAKGQKQKEQEETLKKWKRLCLSSLRDNQIGH
ncbi:hypothetical protein DH2020_021622 [Rehmannia glutinosa]|uniref:Uncharacterized protein n=1 Tax=Rehmannia glutinosa TaxID=99300 RepID=A0ABR0WBL3_REHGL